MGDAQRVGAGGFLAHEGARGADHAMHERDIAGEQVRKLRKEKGGAQIAHQPFVDEGVALSALPRTSVRIAVSTVTSRSPPPAATIMSVLSRISAFLAMPASVQREARRIDADALPGFHLPLIALLAGSARRRLIG